MRLKESTIVYSASVLAFSNLLLQALGFIYRIILGRFGGAEGLGVYRLVFSVYCVINAGCLAGITTACTRLSAEFHATKRTKLIRKLVMVSFAFFLLFFIICTVVIYFKHESIAVHVLGDVRTAAAFAPMLF